MTEARYDLIVRGGTVYDGTGARPCGPTSASLATASSRLIRSPMRMSVRRGSSTRRGLAVAPGFIDVHSHDDAAVLIDPEMACKTLQGVTTDVIGNCGFGIAPSRRGHADDRALTPGLEAHTPWEGYAGYFARLDDAPPSLNVAVLVGHGTARAAVMGNDDRAPSVGELAAMSARSSRRAWPPGAVGLSTGLIYEPGRYAATDEIVALAEGRRRGRRSTRRTCATRPTSCSKPSPRRSRIGERAACPSRSRTTRRAGATTGARCASRWRMIDAARDAWRRGDRSTSTRTRRAARRCSPSSRTARWMRARAASASSAPDGRDRRVGAGHPEWEGRNLARDRRAARDARAAPPTTSSPQRQDGAGRGLEMMCEDDVRTVMRHPQTMIGSDGVPRRASRTRACGARSRACSAATSRDEGVLTFADAVRRMTGFPPRRSGSPTVASSRAGAFADLVVLDPATIADVATYDDPRRPPTGITAVVVNGTVVARDGVHTGARPGRPIRNRA